MKRKRGLNPQAPAFYPPLYHSPAVVSDSNNLIKKEIILSALPAQFKGQEEMGEYFYALVLQACDAENLYPTEVLFPKGDAAIVGDSSRRNDLYLAFEEGKMEARGSLEQWEQLKAAADNYVENYVKPMRVTTSSPSL